MIIPPRDGAARRDGGLPVDSLIRGIIKHKKLVIAVFLLAMLVSAVLLLGVSVNYDLTDYLPEDSESTVALELMYDEFGSGVPNARVMVPELTLTEAPRPWS